MKDQNKIAGLAAVFLFLPVLLLTYSPAVFNHYAHHDDFMFLIKRKDGLFLQHEIMLASGRIVGDWVVYVLKPLIDHVRDFLTFRILTVVLLSLTAAMFLQCVRPYFTRALDAFLFVGIIFSLPPFGVVVQWACATYLAVGLVFAVAAGWYTQKFLHNPARKFNGLVSFVCLMIALLTYQTSAMFYWAMAVFFVMFERERSAALRTAVSFLVIGSGAMGLYGLVLKWLCQPYAKYLEGLYNPYQWTTNYLAKLRWFIEEPLYNAVNLWNIFPSPAAVMISIGLAALSCVIFLVQRPGEISKAPKGLLSGGLLLVFSLLSYLPNLLNSLSVPLYRSSLGLTSIILFLWLWVIQRLLSLIPQAVRSLALTAILFVVFNVGVYQSFKNIFLYRVLPSQMEWSYATATISGADLDAYEKIVFIQPLSRKIHRYDEFGIFTTFFGRDIRPFMNNVFRDTGATSHIKKLLADMTVIEPGDEIAIGPRVLVLDMRRPQTGYERLIDFISR